MLTEPDFVRTDDVVTEAQLRDIFGQEAEDRDEPLDDEIGVCIGEWRREGPDAFRFWIDAECEHEDDA